MKNKKGKSDKAKSGRKACFLGITLAAILIASIFVEGGLAFYPLGKTTYNCTTGKLEPEATYRLGDTICYMMRITNPTVYNLTVDTYDDYPNGTTETLDIGLVLHPGESKTYNRTYVVTADDVARGYVTNVFRMVGMDETGDPIAASVAKTNTILAGEPPEQVPAITPIGMIALIGLLSVIAAISIRRRK